MTNRRIKKLSTLEESSVKLLRTKTHVREADRGPLALVNYIVFMGIAAMLAFVAGAIRAQTPTPPGNPENGKAMYLKDGCYECHGSVGQGGTGPRLGPRPIAAAAFTSYVRKPAGVMPAYSNKVLTDSELADLRAYLMAVPEPPPLKTIRLLNQ